MAEFVLKVGDRVKQTYGENTSASGVTIPSNDTLEVIDVIQSRSNFFETCRIRVRVVNEDSALFGDEFPITYGHGWFVVLDEDGNMPSSQAVDIEIESLGVSHTRRINQ